MNQQISNVCLLALYAQFEPLLEECKFKISMVTKSQTKNKTKSVKKLRRLAEQEAIEDLIERCSQPVNLCVDQF
jgi:hypothetical protein